jgi:hypothetical protein
MKLTLTIIAWLTTIFCGTFLIKRMRLPYENGRFFDPDTSTVIKEQSILGFCLVTVLLLLASLYFTFGLLKRRHLNG